jgi:hypothetical protein
MAMKSRFNKKILLVLPLMAMSLASCREDVSELYGPNPYDTESFVGNYFAGRDDFLGKRGVSQSVSLSSEAIFAGLNDSTPYDGFATPRAKYPSMFVDKNGNALSLSYSTQYAEWNAQNHDDTNYIGVSFGRTLCLARTDDAFKRGIMSKLYDGQIHCDGAYSKSRVQLPEDGYSALFPKTLVSADYFVMFGRWADDSIAGSGDVTADIKLSFYKLNGGVYDSYDITMGGVPFKKNAGGSSTTMLGFKFKDALADYDLDGVAGIGVSYSNVVDEDYPSNAGVTYEATETPGVANSAFMLYETMLIGSSWN